MAAWSGLATACCRPRIRIASVRSFSTTRERLPETNQAGDHLVRDRTEYTRLHSSTTTHNHAQRLGPPPSIERFSAQPPHRSRERQLLSGLFCSYVALQPLLLALHSAADASRLGGARGIGDAPRLPSDERHQVVRHTVNQGLRESGVRKKERWGGARESTGLAKEGCGRNGDVTRSLESCGRALRTTVEPGDKPPALQSSVVVDAFYVLFSGFEGRVDRSG